MIPTVTAPTPDVHLREEEARILGGVWSVLQGSARGGRLDAAGLSQIEIDRMMGDIYHIVAAVVNAHFARVAQGL